MQIQHWWHREPHQKFQTVPFGARYMTKLLESTRCRALLEALSHRSPLMTRAKCALPNPTGLSHDGRGREGRAASQLLKGGEGQSRSTSALQCPSQAEEEVVGYRGWAQ